jgi:hypothetical protein
LQKPEIAREILAYLVDHPEAQDTLEGILRWWLPEQEMKFQTNRVKEALSELVKEGLVLIKHESSDSRVHYGINKSKYNEIQAFIKQSSGPLERLNQDEKGEAPR